MKICYHCGRVTEGKPLFCNHCGRSYNVKLCPKLHPNPRRAEACSLCGSRNLSIPQNKLPLWFKPLMLLLSVIPGIGLLVISILYLGYFTYRLISDPSSLLVPMLVGVLLGLIWLSWMHLPAYLIRLIRRRRQHR